jgi:Xaa-Pro dipeptidase
MTRRDLLAACTFAGPLLGELPEPLRRLRPMTGGVSPISDDERRTRIEKARGLMPANGLGAILLEPGPSLEYFTGIKWGRSERLFACVLPRRGDPAYIVPAFEEARALELIRFGKDIRTWEEDESPFARTAQALKDRGLSSGKIGIEESVRFFVVDGLRKQAPSAQLVSADSVTAGCRMFKSTAELALMQRANEIALAAYQATIPLLKVGITQHEFAALTEAAFQALGVRGFATVTMGKYSAFPHGSVQPQKLKEGDVIVMDGVCAVEGYHGDITRTIVFGKPSQRQREIWNLERKAQDAALAAAKPGATCESVDAAARKVITDAGFGPDYKVPGLPHRTGHGIGLEVHEWTNLVRGNKTRLQTGMCFSDEPMIVIPGEFGMRLEDCFYMTEDGPRLFTKQSPSIDQPFA